MLAQLQPNTITEKFAALETTLNERDLRRWAAVESRSLGRGGIRAVSLATGLSRNTIRSGLRELAVPTLADAGGGRIRRLGGGRKKLIAKDRALLGALEALVEPATRGNPMSPLRWTCKSTAKLAAELTAQGHACSARTVAALLKGMEYSLQVVSKTREGTQHEDRDAQFRHINAVTQRFQRKGQPVISVDTKKKELIGDFANGGREWQPKGQPEAVRTHDFMDKELGKVAPFGVYDVGRNEGWVSVGVDHDTATFAVESIRRWWLRMGKGTYQKATKLLIMADCGGSNGYRLKLWKVELQKLAEETGLSISVCHFPPGTSKWNKIEHRMFCHISENWRGRPLLTREVVVNLIGSTNTDKGLHIEAALDENLYPEGTKITKQQMDAIHLKPDTFHGEWNYTISPTR